jgi:hypothetical protein
MKTLLALILILTSASFTFSQTVQTQPVSKQQVPGASADSSVKTNQPAEFNSAGKPFAPESRKEEVVVENKPLHMGEAPVNIKEVQENKKKESEPVQNTPARKEERGKAIPKK